VASGEIITRIFLLFGQNSDMYTHATAKYVNAAKGFNDINSSKKACMEVWKKLGF